MEKLTVGLGDRSYPIHIGGGCLKTIGEELRSLAVANRYCIIADKTVADLYGNSVMESLKNAGIAYDCITFPPGEESKNLEQFSQLQRIIAQKKFDRKDGIIALGGGVTGDLAGYVAACYMRGIPFIQIPTTLLSQVDSSVGGKTGVDIPEGKNLVGAFYQPKAVFIDPDVLQSLDREEIRGGFAEVIKYGIIWDDYFFKYLENTREKLLNLDGRCIEDVISRCCKIKAEVVAADEKESDLRRILNYGHTIGHAVEAVSQFTIIHGKAVSIGMAAVNTIAVSKGLLSQVESDRIKKVLVDFGLPTDIPEEYDRAAIQRYILTDKKVVSGKVSYILPQSIGKVVITDDVEDELVVQALQH